MSDETDTPRGYAGGPGASAGTPGDQGWTNAVTDHPIDSHNTTDEFAPDYERELQRQIGGFAERVNQLENAQSLLTDELRNLPKKLWDHIVTLGIMLLAALGGLFLMQSGVRDSLQPGITKNNERIVANETNLQATDDKFDAINNRFDGLDGELLDIGDAVNDASRDIAVLQEQKKSD